MLALAASLARLTGQGSPPPGHHLELLPAHWMPPALYAGSHRPLGIDGWRLACLVVALVSAAVGLLNLAFTRDPLRATGSSGGGQQQGHGGHAGGGGGGQPERASLRELAREVLWVVRIPTFVLIVVQVGGGSWAEGHCVLCVAVDAEGPFV